MTFKTKNLGNKGEEAVVKHLKGLKYKILTRNFRTNFGEIDIIAKYKGWYCFIEVKTRNSLEHGEGLESVIKAKQNTIAKVAEYYLSEKNLQDVNVRFDVASVFVADNQMKIEIFENAFEAESAI